MNDVVGEQIDFAALVQNIPDSLVVVDSAINLVFVNQAGVDLLGWKAEDWYGRNLLELVHPDDVAVMVSSATTVLGKNHGTPVEVRVRCADDSWRRVEIVGRDAFRDPSTGGNPRAITEADMTRIFRAARTGDFALAAG